MWSLVASASPYALFVALCVYVVSDYRRGKVVSLTQHQRELAAKDELVALHKARADTEAAARDRERERGDAATAQLTRLAVELPEALRQLKAGQP